MDVLTIQWGWIGGYKTKFIPPVPPVPVIITAIEPRRWPGPSYILWSDEFYFIEKQRRKKEDEEFIIL